MHRVRSHAADRARPRGIVDLGTDPAPALDAGRCSGLDGAAIEVSPGGSWFALGTGTDSDDVRLVEVDAGGAHASLVAEHSFSGDRCGVTADHLGRLVLLIHGPDDGATPVVRLDEAALRC